MNKKRIWMGSLVIGLALGMMACSGPSRPGSTPVVVPGGDQSGDQSGGGVQQPEATDAPSQVETLMAGELATQTAIAGGQQPADQQPADQQPPEPTAAPQEPTAAPSSPEEPTPVPPTAVPEPTKTEEPPPPQADCSSPYTVKAGDWVWDIGRRCNIHPDSIIAANNLRWPYIIYPGDILVLPANAPPFPGP